MNWSWENFFLVLLMGLTGWLMYRHIRSSPQAFSKENLSKSFFTLGILALGLIALIWVLVIFLKT